MTKKCNKCLNEKDLSLFHNKKGGKLGKNHICKECRKSEGKEKVIYIYSKKIDLGSKCSLCEFNNLQCLEFHHLGNKLKLIDEFNKKEDIDKEIDKCILLCSFCHHLQVKYPKNRNLRVKRNYDFVDQEKLIIGNCQDCKRNVDLDNLSAFHFDHLKDKKYNISYMCSNKFSLWNIWQEIKKCQLLCVNCHKIKTNIQFNRLSYLEQSLKINY